MPRNSPLAIEYGSSKFLKPKGQESPAASVVLRASPTPSRTGVEMIGEASHDAAFNVRFQNPDDSAWLPPEYLEFIDRTSALEIDIYRKRWSWRADGTLNQRPQ